MTVLNLSRGDGLIGTLINIHQMVLFHSLLAVSGCIELWLWWYYPDNPRKTHLGRTLIFNGTELQDTNNTKRNKGETKENMIKFTRGSKITCYKSA